MNEWKNEQTNNWTENEQMNKRANVQMNEQMNKKWTLEQTNEFIHSNILFVTPLYFKIKNFFSREKHWKLHRLTGMNVRQE